MSTESDRLDEMAALERLQRERLQEPRMSKLEYFTAMAMQGILSNKGLVDIHTTDVQEWVTSHALGQAYNTLNSLTEKNKGSG